MVYIDYNDVRLDMHLLYIHLICMYDMHLLQTGVML